MLEGKFKCILQYAPNFMKLNKVYEFKNGLFILEDGTDLGSREVVESLESFNRRFHTQIVPYKEPNIRERLARIGKSWKTSEPKQEPKGMSVMELLGYIENSFEDATYLGVYQLGISLEVIIDRTTGEENKKAISIREDIIRRQ